MLSTPSIAMEDAIIAIVNDELITLKDLQIYIHNTYVSLVAQGIGDEQLQQIMLDLEIRGIDKLIEDKLLLSEANKLGLEIRDKAIDDRIKSLIEKYPSEQQFMDALVQNGSTITDLRNKITEQIKITSVIEYKVRSKIYISPQEVTQYYEENINDFQIKEQINLDSILILYDNDKKATRAKANEALTQIKAGKDFKEVAEQYSDSPSIGIVKRGQLLPEIEKEIFHLTKNEPSSLIETDTGIYIFKLLARKPAQLAELNDVKETIENTLLNLKFRDHFNDWLKKLKKDAYIEIKQ